MNREVFEQALQIVRASRLPVDAVEYSFESFGSWYITLQTNPSRRLVWDGKERWLFVEQETGEKSDGIHQWRDVWMDRMPTEKVIRIAVDVLCATSREDQEH